MAIDADSIFSDVQREAGINQITIQGKVYSFEILPTTAGLIMWERLLTTFGPAIGVVIDNAGKEDLLPEEETMFTDLFIALTRQMPQLKMAATARDMLNNLKCDGQDVDFEKHFAGKHGLLMLCLEESFRLNFLDLFVTYLEAKGLGILTLKTAMTRKQEENNEPSNDS